MPKTFIAKRAQKTPDFICLMAVIYTRTLLCLMHIALANCTLIFLCRKHTQITFKGQTITLI